MQWPIHDILDEQKSYYELLSKLYNDQLRCANCDGSNYYRHSLYRDEIDKYRCRDCQHVFHVFSGTVFSGTTMKCSKILMILRGFFKGQSTRSLALELNMDRKHLLSLRHKVQNTAFNNRSANGPGWMPLPKPTNVTKMLVNPPRNRTPRSRLTRPAGGRIKKGSQYLR